MAINGIAIADFKFETLQSKLKAMRMEDHFINKANLFLETGWGKFITKDSAGQSSNNL